MNRLTRGWRAGVWWEPLREAIKKAPPRGASYLRSVASGTAWTQSRLFYARRVETVTCQACGEAPGTLVHRHYECGGWSGLERQTVLTQPILEAALRRHPCRSHETLLLPSPFAAVAPPPQADGLLRWVGPQCAERLLSGTDYTDGSTYEPKLQALSRSGCGFAAVDNEGAFLTGVAAGGARADDV